jgi:hypothetical protein
LGLSLLPRRSIDSAHGEFGGEEHGQNDDDSD